MSSSSSSFIPNCSADGSEGVLVYDIQDSGNLSDVTRFFRSIPPSQYTLEIHSFSQLQKILSKTEIKCFESQIFEAGGYKWKLGVYPDGDERRNGEGYISMFIKIAEPEALHFGWEVRVEFKFFIFDQIRDCYLVAQEAWGKIRRFHRMKTEWGIAQLISHKEFYDGNKGYLVGDRCVFGVEIFIISQSGKGECLSMSREPIISTHICKFGDFSSVSNSLNQLCHTDHSSQIFTLANYQWKLELHPDSRDEENMSLSLILCTETVSNDSEHSSIRVYAEYGLTVVNQLNINHNLSHTGYGWFIPGSNGWGFSKFITSREMVDSSKGYVVDDTLIVKVRIDRISTLNCFS